MEYVTFLVSYLPVVLSCICGALCDAGSVPVTLGVHTTPADGASGALWSFRSSDSLTTAPSGGLQSLKPPHLTIYSVNLIISCNKTIKAQEACML